MRIKKKKLIIFTILILVVISVYFIFFRKNEASEDFKQMPSGDMPFKDGDWNKEGKAQGNKKKITQTAEVKSASDENIELHATYYLEEVYVSESEYVEAGTNILKYTNGTYLTAPYNCCITDLNIPAIGGQCLNSHYVQISSTNILSVSMNIDETKINNYSVGNEAEIEISSIGKTYKGYITHIGSIASNGKFEVTIEFENDGDIKLGMTSSVSI